MKSYLLLILFTLIPLFIFSQPCTVNDATGCVCEDGSTDCLLLPNIKIAYDLLADPTQNPESPGELRVSVSSPNIGHGPLRVIATNNFVCGTDTLWNSNITVCPDGSTPSQLVIQRIYRKQGNNMSYIDRWAGTMTYHPMHNHSHFDEWGVYTLRIPDPNEPDPLKWTVIGEGSKLGFCLMDFGSCQYYDGHCRDENNNVLRSDAPNFGLGGGQYSCGVTNQGISAGWTDIYYHYLDGMFITIPPGTCNGDYMLVVEVDPNNVLLEENDDDNVMVAPITLTKQTNPNNVNPTTTISVNGPTAICDGDQTQLSVPRTGSAYLWSTGETTGSITVTTPGTYTCQVTTPCGIATDNITITQVPNCGLLPIIINDNFTINEDNILTGNVLNNDIANGNNLSVNALPVDAPDYGTLTLNDDGTFTYSPNNDFNGTDSFTYQACTDSTPGSSTPGSFTGQIVSGNDDAEELVSGLMNMSSGDLDLMNDNGELHNTIGLRYSSVDIPKGALVTYAYLQFTADESNSQSTSLRLDAALIPNAGPISNAAYSLSSQPRSNVYIAWNNVPSWSAGSVYESVDISYVIQELVNQSGWQSGNAALLLIEGSGTRTADSYEGGAGVAPKLFVEYLATDEPLEAVCSEATVNININAMNDAPLTQADTIYATSGTTVQHNILANDSDIENDNLSVTPMSTATLSIASDGHLTFTPDTDFPDAAQMTYEVCDDGNPAACSSATIVFIVEQGCVDLQLHAYLEGAYRSNTGEMTTTLNTNRHLLPGQTPASNLITPTPAGQPYHIAPWNYSGQEGANWTDADYEADVVDWVLVSFREGSTKDTEVAMTAALLHKDGRISFPDRCALSTTSATNLLYVLVEHRNHIGVMSAAPVPIIDHTLTYDFRSTDSYRDPTGYGQKLLSSGVWCMYSGDGNQAADFPSFDVNGQDKAIWVNDNGQFDYYRVTDFNLDGDINGADKSLWYGNNGISSRVPK